jgi:RHH-type proline utilization regulon transcriptional repressor/proline dehydrogenase/delta 1-pyrroline-5-carboxylate dehydrogenase
MLGEGARTHADAERYLRGYQAAITTLAAQSGRSLEARSGVSVKLSALEPRYSELQRAEVRCRLVPVVQALAASAARANVGLTIDAEEADRLDLSLDIIEAVARDAATAGWDGLGLAVQAYNRHATDVIDWVVELAQTLERRMTVRIVKGAYWDTEIKRAQERGIETYPVFTVKAATDINYLACLRRLFAARHCIYPQLATHNAMTISAALALAPAGSRYEFQRLYGMGAALYEIVREESPQLAPVRVYAPVGVYQDLLPYLVRRLLENGANSSFVHRFRDSRIAPEVVADNPLDVAPRSPAQPPAGIPEPQALFGKDRINSEGVDWGNREEIEALEQAARSSLHDFSGGPIVSGMRGALPSIPVLSPANSSDLIGHGRAATPAEITAAFNAAEAAQPAWDATAVEERAAVLLKASDLLEMRRLDFVNLLVREAGKNLPDAIAEIREAVDFCRYYAARARESFGAPAALVGPAGERNTLSLHGRGVFACISPWNFPLAIFTGQIVAALAAGNSVIAKPAPATTLIAHEMVTLLHEAGIPAEVLHLTPADGPAFSAVAMQHRALAGVAFTGSTTTAHTLNRALAARDGAIATLIAETGGVNAMIVDSTALPEQVVDDLVASAFTSAGQRCSAARLVYVQEEIADRVIEMLTGAMRALVIGDPANAETDLGPIISAEAAAKLRAHIDQMRREAKVLLACELPQSLPDGNYFPPHLIELNAPDQLKSEQFGPILHLVRYTRNQLPQVLAAIRDSGFGLTLGIQSRLESLPAAVCKAAPVGNLYINRNMIGASVGVQPFGGHGLSGTGPKAGGPHYLYRFATERTVTINTTAIGGNPELLTLGSAMPVT